MSFTSTPSCSSSSNAEKEKRCEELIADLRRVFNQPQTPTDDEVSNTLASFAFSATELARFSQFDATRYTRNLLALDEKFSLLLICWSPGQSSPVHHHGNKGVKSWVRVLKGTLSTIYGYESECQTELEDSKRHDIILTEDSPISVTEDSMGLHRTGNGHDGLTISLHLYSPPYVECTFKKQQALEDGYIPVVHRPEINQCSPMAPLSTKELNMVVSGQKSAPVFANFCQLVDVLQREIKIEPAGTHSHENISHVKKILSLMHFNPREVQQYAKFCDTRYTRNLIGYDEKFTILLLCWDKGQASPIHDHANSNCWVKVIDGQLQECLYDVQPDDSVTLKADNIYNPGGVTYINDSYGVHKMGNPNLDRVSMSLHVYSPPYHKCSTFSPERPLRQIVSIGVAYGAKYPFMEKQLEDKTCQELNPIATNLDMLINCLKAEFQNPKPNWNNINLLLTTLQFSESEWKQYLHFNPDQYNRNLLSINEHFSLLLICWAPNQKTPPHDHGTTGASSIRVLDGVLMVNKFFGEESDPLRKSSDGCTLIASGQNVIFQNEELGTHTTLNGSSQHNAISLHLYSPPYVECTSKCQRSVIPVSYCSRDASKATRLPPTVQCKSRKMLFVNFGSFAELMSSIFDQPQSGSKSSSAVENKTYSPCEVKHLISQTCFNPKEWREFACTTFGQNSRNLVSCSSSFSVYLNTWAPSQRSTIHDHGGSHCWIKVLEGNLEDSFFTLNPETQETSLDKTCKLTTDSVSYYPKQAIHQTVNPTQSFVYTLHVYSPPFENCYCYKSCSSAPASPKIGRSPNSPLLHRAPLDLLRN